VVQGLPPHTHVMLRSAIWYLLLYLHTHTRHATIWDLLLHLHTHVRLRPAIFSCYLHTYVMLRFTIFSCYLRTHRCPGCPHPKHLRKMAYWKQRMERKIDFSTYCTHSKIPCICFIPIFQMIYHIWWNHKLMIPKVSFGKSGLCHWKDQNQCFPSNTC